MCFHSKQTKDAASAEKRFNAVVRDLVNFKSSEHYKGFDYPETPVITGGEPGVIDQLHWGLIPPWAGDESIRQYTLNAKIETLAEKPSFRDSVNRRCLVLADGFYEWQWLDAKGKNKRKYLITLPDGALYAYAGIWSEWVSTRTGELIRTYSIVTTEATGIMREIHNSKLRMPVILTPENEQAWLQQSPIDDFIRVDVPLEALLLDAPPSQGLLF
jgi:putative SOS response-associated peptidase YedK